MKKIFAISALAIGILAAPNAMAIHQCGQLLGSCLVHIDPIVLPEPVPAPVPAVPLEVQEIRPALVPVAPTKCYKESEQGNLVEIDCPR